MSERDRVAEIYGRHTGKRAWSADNPGNQAIREEVAQRLLPLATGRVLDAGCGTGWWLRRLAEAGVAAQGLELLPERVAAATASGASVVTGDVRDLPFADGEFALVTLLTVLSSLNSDDDVRQALREARRVGHRVAIWEPRYPNPLNRDTRLIRKSVLREELVAPTIATLTLLPPLARRTKNYDRLARLPPLRSHRLIVAPDPRTAPPAAAPPAPS